MLRCKIQLNQAPRSCRNPCSLAPVQGKRGVFVVEAIGGGLKSRAVIRKGSLAHVSRVSAAGTAVTILDDDMQVVTGGRSAWFPSYASCSRTSLRMRMSSACSCFYGDAGNIGRALLSDLQISQRNETPACHRVWVNGEEYPVDAASGEAVIPFSASRGDPLVVLIAGDDFAALATLDVYGESYSLAAGAD